MRNTFAGVINLEGNTAKFKSWIFDLIAAVGSVEQSLAKDLRFQLNERPQVEVIDNKFDVHFEIDSNNHAKYEDELYALIVGLTSGETKCVVKRGRRECRVEGEAAHLRGILGKVRRNPAR